MATNEKTPSTFGTAAYGGENWSQRQATHQQELGEIWGGCGIDSEWRELQSVLLHCPGDELNAAQNDPEAVQMLAPVDVPKAQDEHDAMVEVYRSQGVEVHFVEPELPCQPNLMFCADLFVMTPQGAILAVGAGEQRPVVRDGALSVATVMTCTLSCDHRVVDGAIGAEFLAAFKAMIEEPMAMLL